MKNHFKCVFCKQEFWGYGNNPRPLRKRGRCCNDCNMMVIKHRIELIKKNSAKLNQLK